MKIIQLCCFILLLALSPSCKKQPPIDANLSEDKREILTMIEKVKTESGASNDEIKEGLKAYTDLYIRLQKDSEGGAIDIDKLARSMKYFDDFLKTNLENQHHQDEMAAAWTLMYLIKMEEDSVEKAQIAMKKNLVDFVNSEHEGSKDYDSIRNSILEYSKRSELLKKSFK